MSCVLKFPGQLPKPVVEEKRYFCTKCAGDEFHLSPTGAIHCVKCAARMRNLIISVVTDVQR